MESGRAGNAQQRTLQLSYDLSDRWLGILLDRVVGFVVATMPFTCVECLVNLIKQGWPRGLGVALRTTNNEREQVVHKKIAKGK